MIGNSPFNASNEDIGFFAKSLFVASAIVSSTFTPDANSTFNLLRSKMHSILPSRGKVSYKPSFSIAF